MKFGFDVDGVITEFPELFSAITNALKKSGHYIYIITDFDEHWRQTRVDELSSYNIVYDELIITGRKEDFVKENKVDYMIDDDIEYFSTLKAIQLFAIKS